MRRKNLLRACALSVLTALLLGSSSIAFAAEVPYPVSATIEVGGEIIDMAVDETSGTVYVLKGQSQVMPTTYSLVVINGTTVTATIPIDGTARRIGVDSGDHTVYVTTGDKVVVIKGTSVTNTVPVGWGAHNVAVDSSTHTAYVAQIDGASVALINGGSVTSTVPTGPFPSDLVVDSMTHTAYVLVEAGTGGGGWVYSAIQPIVNGIPTQEVWGALPTIGPLAFDPVENRLLFWNMENVAEYKDGKVTQFPDFFPNSDRARMLTYDAETRTFFFAKSLGGNESGYELTAERDGRFESLGKFTLGRGRMVVDTVHDKVLLEQLDKVIVMDSKWPDPKAPQGRDADGFADVLARDGAGNLWMYPGNGTGGWLPQRQVGTGWNVMSELTVPGDFNGDGFSDVLARDAVGYLWMYPGDGTGGWLPRVRVGSGWNAMSALTGPGDFNGDGFADLLARDGAGNLWMYPGNGKGGWLPQVQVGCGWNAMSELTGPGDFNGDSYADLLARDGAGNLWMYPGNGKGGWLPQVRVGSGWNAMSPVL
ncbi:MULTISPECIES: FG-GAP-like repeat-containing protein [unclassified Arthrobacter]|uniref:FG-GAP-like repeat-containing protein n=1 Tax=unclassified Arthrobacter TaxID=235627 RepID=UPI002157D59A|nr:MULTISPECIES: FG-GAP-like repeat-containing protein [unclassified Arthrobacter]